MRTVLQLAAATLVGAATLVLAPPARAQDFPAADGDYEPLPCGRHDMDDRRRDEVDAIDERDLVGDADDPAGFRAVDDDFLYLRLRLDRDPFAGGTIRPFAWGIEIDTDNDRNDYEVLALVEGVTGNLLLYENTVTTTANDPTDPADTPAVASYALATHTQSGVAAGSSFGDDEDFYLSFALPWTDLEMVGVTPTTPVRVWAASSTASNSLNGDFACHDGAGGPAGFDDIDSDRTVFDPDRDSDGDGATDADEIEGGSDPNDPDSKPGGGGGLALAGGGGCEVGAGAPNGAGVALVLACLALARLVGRRRRAQRARF